MGRTSLYRHFDKNGRLLYVGISGDYIKRTRQHLRGSDWFWDVARIDLEHFPDRESAESAEASAIRDENPVHNSATPKPLSVVDVMERQRRRCPVPEVIGSGTSRMFGYADIPVSEVQGAIGFFRRCGIPDGLIFIDILGQELNALGRCIKFARDDGIRILNLSDGRFDDFLELLGDRGVYVHTVRGNGQALYAYGDDISDLLEMVAQEQNAANVRKSRNKV